MTANSLLEQIAVCPADHAPLSPRNSAGEEVAFAAATSLVCTKCKATYVVDSGIPVLLPKESA